MKHKVGDIVHIKSLSWYKTNLKKENGYNGYVMLNNPYFNFFSDSMSIFCGKKAKIISIRETAISHQKWYDLKIGNDNNYYCWVDEMFEDIKEIRKKKIEKLNGSKI